MQEHHRVSDDEIYAYMALLEIKVLNESTLNSAYRRLMRVHHVDKGGNLEINQSLTRAHRILKLCLEDKRFIPVRYCVILAFL